MKNQIILEKTEGACRTLIFNRPERLNAISIELAEGLRDALRQAAEDPQVRVVVLRGAGRAFSAGGDLQYLKTHRNNADQIFKTISHFLNEVAQIITTMPKPVVAAIHGPAFAAGFGGALTCDILVATKGSQLSPSFINIAIAPNASTTYFLPRILGPKIAAEAFIRGRVFKAEEAKSLGIINHAWEEELFEGELQLLIKELSTAPTQAIGRMKKLLRSSYHLNFNEQLELEREEISASSFSDDFEEGITAFVEKRKPSFKGN